MTTKKSNGNGNSGFGSGGMATRKEYGKSKSGSGVCQEAVADTADGDQVLGVGRVVFDVAA